MYYCRALEEKKRAMAVAEEQRRRKALEDRRKAQLEATARFRSAICRVKSNPKARHKPMDNVESRPFTYCSLWHTTLSSQGYPPKCLGRQWVDRSNS